MTKRLPEPRFGAVSRLGHRETPALTGSGSSTALPCRMPGSDCQRRANQPLFTTGQYDQIIAACLVQSEKPKQRESSQCVSSSQGSGGRAIRSLVLLMLLATLLVGCRVASVARQAVSGHIVAVGKALSE